MLSKEHRSSHTPDQRDRAAPLSWLQRMLLWLTGEDNTSLRQKCFCLLIAVLELAVSQTLIAGPVFSLLLRDVFDFKADCMFTTGCGQKLAFSVRLECYL